MPNLFLTCICTVCKLKNTESSQTIQLIYTANTPGDVYLKEMALKHRQVAKYDTDIKCPPPSMSHMVWWLYTFSLHSTVAPPPPYFCLSPFAPILRAWPRLPPPPPPFEILVLPLLTLAFQTEWGKNKAGWCPKHVSMDFDTKVHVRYIVTEKNTLYLIQVYM